MNFADYQAEAVKTAIYPRDAAIIYPALGLAGEVGEVAEKMLDVDCPAMKRDVLGMAAHAGEAANQAKKIIRDDAGNLTEARKQAIGKEIGGTLWYCASLAHDIGMDLDDIAQQNLDILASRQERGTLMGDGDNR